MENLEKTVGVNGSSETDDIHFRNSITGKLKVS